MFGNIIVLTLTASHLHKWWRWFKKKQTYFCGTAQAATRDWPRESKNPKFLRWKRSESINFQHDIITAVVLHETHVILILSMTAAKKLTFIAQELLW